MAARARIVEGPYPADAGPGLLLALGTRISADAAVQFLLVSPDEADAIPLTSLCSEISSWTRARIDSGAARVPPDRTTIGVVRGDRNIFRRGIDLPEVHLRITEYFQRLPISPAVSVEGDRVLSGFSLYRHEAPDQRQIEGWLSPLLERQEASATVSISPADQMDGPGFKLAIEIEREFPLEATLGDAWRLGEDALALVEIVQGVEIPRSMGLDLLRAGRHGVFRGQPESDWLEAKGAPYELTKSLGKNWKYELAKDVAAFANAPEGGLIVIGMTTRDEGDGEVISGFKEFDLKQVTATSYGNFVAQHVYPRVEGFEVLRVPGRERGQGIAALVIPPQAPSNLPFLVRGVVDDGEVLGNHVLWPVRQGDQTALLDIDAIHSRLRLGDRAIRD